MTVEDTLQERKITCGDFLTQAGCAQLLKQTIRNTPNWKSLRVDQRESLEMICTKMSRILHGDKNHIDSWHDISGYATLIEATLRLDEARKNGGA
jgi:hypothetical protein